MPRFLLRCGALALGLGTAACDVPKEVNPVWIYDQVSGRADRNREPPPGLDQPYPNLASVPPRPEKPPLATREQLSNALVEDRSRSREPLQPGQVGAAASFAPSPGEPSLPAAPPPPPQLAGARPIPWDEPEPAAPASRPGTPQPGTGQGGAAPQAGTGQGGAVPPARATRGETASPAAVMPSAPPPAPPPDLLGPPPLPPADMLAPAPARR